MVEYIKYTPKLSNNWSKAWSETQKQRPWQSRRLLDSSTTTCLLLSILNVTSLNTTL